MTDGRTGDEPSNSAEPPLGCTLLRGGAVCHCADDAPRMSERDIESRAHEMFLWQQRAPAAGRAAARRGLDRLLVHARVHSSDGLVIELLRLGILQRVIDERNSNAEDVDALVRSFSELAESSGDECLLAEAAVLRAHRLATFTSGDSALPDTAHAMAILSEVDGPSPGADAGTWHLSLARTLNELVLVLIKLGCHELADEMSQRAIIVARVGSGPVDLLIHQLNRVRLQLSWALRLERGGRDAAAASRLLTAAQIADAAGRQWEQARRGGAALPPVRDCTAIGAAHALHRPSVEHLPMLRRLNEIAVLIDDRIMLAIATSRCLGSSASPVEALTVLEPLRDTLVDGVAAEPVLALALHRELARVESSTRWQPSRAAALERYAGSLEDELWAMREARLVALRTQSEHRRLTRAHGAVAAQALQDPLTGLPNRRALDLRLAEAVSTPLVEPCAVALIDLDGFKAVNDARSHAAGDQVLQAIAGALRSTLRARDMVARYGGDEFVVVMPGTELHVARSALTRAALAVAALPPETAAGVTLSVGVVDVVAGGEPSDALAAADAAMYRAKHQGGNSVVVGAVSRGTAAERAAHSRRVMSAVTAAGPFAQASRVIPTETSNAAALPPEKMPLRGGTSA